MATHPNAFLAEAAEKETQVAALKGEVEDLKARAKAAERDFPDEFPQESAEAEESKEESKEKPLSKMNKTELQQVAKDEEVEVDEEATKAELVEAIEASREEEPDEEE